MITAHGALADILRRPTVKKVQLYLSSKYFWQVSDLPSVSRRHIIADFQVGLLITVMENKIISYDPNDFEFSVILENLTKAEYRNCLKFREELYSLQTCLHNSLKRKFEKHHQILTEKNATDSYVKEYLARFRSDKFCNTKQPDINEWRNATTGWIILANYYSGWLDVNMMPNRVDPTELLKVVRGCTMFENIVRFRADIVVKKRNMFYAHIKELKLQEENKTKCTEAIVFLFSCLK